MKSLDLVLLRNINDFNSIDLIYNLSIWLIFLKSNTILCPNLIYLNMTCATDSFVCYF